MANKDKVYRCIKFQYRDRLTPAGKWSYQECFNMTLAQCKKIYGLGIDPDCEYKILSKEE